MMEHISQNVENIFETEMERFRTKLLTSSRTEQLYRDILINATWSDKRQGSLRKLDYVFGDSNDCEEHHSTEHIAFLFVHTTRETIKVSTEHTYRRGFSALAFRPTILARMIAWLLAYMQIKKVVLDDPSIVHNDLDNDAVAHVYMRIMVLIFFL